MKQWTTRNSSSIYTLVSRRLATCNPIRSDWCLQTVTAACKGLSVSKSTRYSAAWGMGVGYVRAAPSDMWSWWDQHVTFKLSSIRPIKQLHFYIIIVASSHRRIDCYKQTTTTIIPPANNQENWHSLFASRDLLLTFDIASNSIALRYTPILLRAEPSGLLSSFRSSSHPFFLLLPILKTTSWAHLCDAF